MSATFLSLTCLRPAQNMSETWSKTWFEAGFEQDRSDGIWALLCVSVC